MPITAVHPFVSGIADGGDATLVRPSNWNAAHTVTEVLVSSNMTPASVTVADGFNAVIFGSLTLGASTTLTLAGSSRVLIL
jgi:hypothetical protein